MPRKRKLTPSFVLTLPLQVSHYESHILNKRFEIARKIYNACLTEADKRLSIMRESKAHQRARKLPKTTHSERKIRSVTFQKLNKYYQFEEYSLHTYVSPMQKRYKHLIDSHSAQKLATRAFKAVQKKQFGEAKKVRYKRFDELESVEGKTNQAGIRFKDNIVHWLGLSLPIILKSNDSYAHQALLSRVKYGRIVRKWIKGRHRYDVQLILEGTPPPKYNRVGKKGQLGKGKVGMDIGTQTVTIVSDLKASLLELAPSVNEIQREIRLIQRALDRSRRSMNPEKYREDGTIKPSRTKWVYSKRYQKKKSKLQELQGKNASKRKQDHGHLANQIIEQGHEFFIETMNFKALQKRSKDTKKKENGSFKSKKRFGKSLARKAPAMFVSILEQKLASMGIELKKIHTAKVKASQYNHETDTFEKKELSTRWNLLFHQKVQRDLYSAFLVTNVNSSLDQIVRRFCIEGYDHFKRLHDEEITRIQASPKKRIQSFGL
ncbi:nuclease/transposase family protein [Pseudoneobacillus sp. C159]